MELKKNRIKFFLFCLFLFCSLIMNGQIELSNHLSSYSKNKLEVQFKLKNNSENIIFINECLSANLTLDFKILLSIFYKLENDTSYKSVAFSGSSSNIDFDDFSNGCFVPLNKDEEFTLKINLRNEFKFDVIDSLLNDGKSLFLCVYLLSYYKESETSSIRRKLFFNDFLFINAKECYFEVIN